MKERKRAFNLIMLRRDGWGNTVIALLKAFFVAAFLIVFFVLYNQIVKGGMENSVYKFAVRILKQLAVDFRFWLIVLVGMAVLYVFLKNSREILGFLFRYRFLLCLILFVFCVLLEVSGSSIGMWNTYVGGSDGGILLGVSRPIRTDEWAVSTPMALSQYVDPQGAFSYYSSVVRGTATDVFLEYGQPVKDLAVIFRPFHWGYLFLPAGKGLAFYWCGRYLALFLVSFEMGRVLTNDNRRLAVLYSVLIGWAPTVQWWFAVNGLVEMLIYIQLSILLMIRFMDTDDRKKRLLYILGIFVCAGGYLFTMYPAWQIPLAYTLLGLAVWTFWEHHGQCVMKMKDWVSVGMAVLLFLGIVAYILLKSKDTISSIMSTAYPGERFETGGGFGKGVFDYVASIVFALTGEGVASNVCESSRFIDFFPVCYLIPGIVLFRDKKKDKLLIIMALVSLFLEAWVICGFPGILSKVTLLSNCPAPRVLQIVGFTNIILLVRAMSLMERSPGAAVSVIVGCVLSAVAYLAVRTENVGYFGCATSLLILTAFGIMFSLIQMVPKRRCLNGCLGVCCAVMFLSGFLVNPVRRGVENVYENECYKAIREIHEKDQDALWVVEGKGMGTIGNFLIMAGAPTINSINVYPVMERWAKIDTDGQYEDIYNRYAHITIQYKDAGEAKFSSKQADSFTVKMTLEDMKKINTSYILSKNDLKGDKDTKIVLEKKVGEYKIYKLE